MNATQIDEQMRQILSGDSLAESAERLSVSMEELEEVSMRIKRERDLAISALKAAVGALRRGDEKRRKLCAELIEASLLTMGERL